MIQAAGILFIADGQVLLLQRSDQGDAPGAWGAPGGKMEAGETAEQAAVRECKEELGTCPTGARKLLCRRVKDGVDYTTFVQLCDKFNPVLNDEHTGFMWADPQAPPEPLHPGCAVALAKLTADELDIARMISSGDLVSPQIYQNVALFALRITGTGAAYRVKNNEYTWRDPTLYLNERFLARCNGLPVLWDHPEKPLLDSDEFSKRIVGTIFLPYINDNEVWGIAKVFDKDAITMMGSEVLSTSPGVLLGSSLTYFRPLANDDSTLDDGGTVLIEGTPSLVDHVAICELGVWDKGGAPQGVLSSTAVEATMPEEDKDRADAARKDAEEKEREDKARKDAEERATRLDACMSRMDKFMADTVSRLDAMEDQFKKDAEEKKVKGEPEQPVADKSRKDAEEKEREDKSRKDAEEKEREDKSRKDAEEKEREDKARKDAADTAARLAALERNMPKVLSDEDYNKMAEIQARADSVAQLFGSSAPRPLAGETPFAYRKRQLSAFQKHSTTWKDIDLSKIVDEGHFGVVESQVYADAQAAALNPTDLPANTLRAITRRDGSGRAITEFVGSPEACWAPFKMDPMGARLRRVSQEA